MPGAENTKLGQTTASGVQQLKDWGDLDSNPPSSMEAHSASVPINNLFGRVHVAGEKRTEYYVYCLELVYKRDTNLIKKERKKIFNTKCSAKILFKCSPP